MEKVTNLPEAIVLTAKDLAKADLSIGQVPQPLLLAEVVNAVRARRGWPFGNVKEGRFKEALEKGLVVPGGAPPLPLALTLEEHRRGQFRVSFNPFQANADAASNFETRTSSKEERFQQVVKDQSLFDFKNPKSFQQRLELALKESRPFRFGYFVCLPGEWVVVMGKPFYTIKTDRYSRIESAEFQNRTLELLSELEATGVSFRWSFIIGDTDPQDVFASWLLPSAQLREEILAFQERIKKSLGNILPECTDTPLWSDIQRPYQKEYDINFRRVSEMPVIKNDIEQRLNGRMGYYRGYFAKRGEEVFPKLLEPLCKVIPIGTISMYGAQGPIIEKEYDCLVIGDRDPKRLGDYHSLLSPNLPIWYPYFGG